MIEALAARFPVRDGEVTRPLRAGDVALLFARTSGIEHYEEALRRAGLPFRQEGGRLFFRRQEIRDLLHALAAIEDPHDEMAIVATLRSALCGITDEELWLHRVAHLGFDYLEPVDRSAVGDRLALLASLHAERHANGVAGTIAALLDGTEARGVYAARPQGEQALANLEMLERLARQFEASRPAGLREFVRSLRDLDEEAPRVAEWTPQGEDAERGPTAHGSRRQGPRVSLRALGEPRGGGEPPRVGGRRGPSGRAGGSIGCAPAISRARSRPGDMRRCRARSAGGKRPRSAGCSTSRQPGRATTSWFRATTDPRRWGCSQLSARCPRRWERPVRSASGCAGPAAGAGGRFGLGRRRPTGGAPREPTPRRGSTPKVDLSRLWLRRAGLAAEVAGRLSRAAAGRAVTVPDLGVGAESGSWARLRVLLATALESIPSHLRGSELQSAALALAALHGSSDLVADLLSAIEASRGGDWGARAKGSRRQTYGARITSRRGRNWIEAWLDCVLEEPDGLVLVEWERSTAPEPQTVRAASEERVLWKALALADDDLPVREAGRLFLATGAFVPVGDLQARLAGLRQSVEARS